MDDSACHESLRAEDVMYSLCRAVVTDSSLRVAGPNEGYRCKATYSLTPRLITSPLAQPVVNTVAETVAEFVTQHSVMPSIAPHFFFEVMGKVNRLGETLIKVAFVNRRLPASLMSSVRSALPDVDVTGPECTLFDMWCASRERTAFCTFLQERLPSLVAVVAHVCLDVPLDDNESTAAQTRKEVVRKPDKACAYVPLLSNGATTITEYTPNKLPFQLSSDSFCEVNQPMEDAIYTTIKSFLRLDSDDVKHRDVFITGRDVNSVVKTFEQFYTTVACATTCPSVFEDTKMNGIGQCQFCHKDELFKPLAAFHQSVMPPPPGPTTCTTQRHVLLTAGRHGLHPRTSQMLAAMASDTEGHLTDVIYVSCNVHSMARDLHILKTSLFVAHARTFDFFPGTDYVMTVLHLQPVSPRRSRLLVLPIGMPCAGKSLAGRALAAFFAARVPPLQTGTKPMRAKRRKTESTTTTAAHFVPRTYARVAENVTVTRFERDAVFHTLRSQGASLKQTKLTLHAALLAALAPHPAVASNSGSAPTDLRSPVPALLEKLARPHDDEGADDVFQLATSREVVYLDSTNGDAAARALYVSTFHADTDSGNFVPPHSPLLCAVELAFNTTEPMSEDATLKRVAARRDHPGFPTELDAQRRKLQAIATMLGSEQAIQTAPGATRVVIDSASDGCEADTVRQVVLAVCAHLWFDAPLATSLRSAALCILRDTVAL